MCASGDAILVVVCVYVLICCDGVHALDAASLSDSSLCSHARNIARRELLNLLAQNLRHTIYILTQTALRLNVVTVVASIACGAGHIYCYGALVEHCAEPRTTEFWDVQLLGLGEQVLTYRQTVAVDPLLVVVHSVVDQLRVGIYAREYKICREWLQRSILLRLHRHTCHSGQIAIARSIDKDLTCNGLATILILENNL